MTFIGFFALIYLQEALLHGGEAMAKVSRNIKKLRSERKMTQDILAEKINVTRQTVSSWENDRTQPDIEMLEQLANVFEVSLEEIIYGEKRNVGFEPSKSDNRKTMMVVFATLGTLLTVAGLLIVFIASWDHIPDGLLAVLMFLPLLAGCAAALFAYFKKRQSIAWCEGASVAWAAGLAITNALVNANFNADIGFISLLIIDAVLILPMAFILDSVFPLTAYFACITAWNMLLECEYSLVMLPLFGAGLIYVFKSRSNSIKHKYSVWVSVITAAVTVVSACCFNSKYPWAVFIYLLLAIFTALYAADKGGDFPYPFRYVSVPAAAIVLSVLCYDIDWLFSDYSKNYPCIPQAVTALAIIAAGIALGRKSFKKNPLKAAFVSVCAAVSVALAACTLFNRFTLDFELQVFVIFAALAASIILVISGIKNAKLSTVNLGLIMICYIIFITLFMGEFEFIYSGIACAVMGIILLLINKALSKSFKEREADKNA